MIMENNNDDTSPNINDAQDIDSCDAVVVASWYIFNIYVRPIARWSDLQIFCNINKPNILFVSTSIQQNYQLFKLCED